jgi:hypothetical protein
MHVMEEDEKNLPVFGFGIGGPIRPGERTPQQQIDDVLARHALAAALLRYRRRGAPVKKWRKDLREPVLAAMAKYPDLSNAQMARILWKIEPCKSANINNVRVIENWVSAIRRGGVGYGRQRR